MLACNVLRFNQFAPSDDALGVLVSIADRSSKVVEEYTLPVLFSSLPDLPLSLDAHRERAKCWRTLRWLAQLCVSAPLFETLVVRLTTKLDIVCGTKSESSEDYEARIAYAHGILRTVASVLEVKAKNSHADIPKYIDRLVPRLYNLFIALSFSEISTSSKSFLRLLEVSGEVITVIVRTVPVECVINFVVAHFNKSDPLMPPAMVSRSSIILKQTF